MSKVIRLPFDLETDEFEEMQWFHKQFMKSHPVLKYFVQKSKCDKLDKGKVIIDLPPDTYLYYLYCDILCDKVEISFAKYKDDDLKGLYNMKYKVYDLIECYCLEYNFVITHYIYRYIMNIMDCMDWNGVIKCINNKPPMLKCIKGGKSRNGKKNNSI